MDNDRLKTHLHVPSKSPFFGPFKNGFNAAQWCCLHITLKRSKLPLTKTVTLAVRVNEPLDSVEILYLTVTTLHSSRLLLMWWLENRLVTDHVRGTREGNVFSRSRSYLLSCMEVQVPPLQPGQGVGDVLPLPPTPLKGHAGRKQSLDHAGRISREGTPPPPLQLAGSTQE